MRRITVIGVALTIALAATCTRAADEQTSQNNDFLKRALERFPQADLNNDGVLTQSEATTFRDHLQKLKERAEAGKPAPTHANVHYGDHARQVFDIWLAKSERPTPLVIYIHGGGFVGGDKSSIAAEVINPCLESGVSVAAIHYRFATTDPFPACFHDAARCVQLLRSKAQEYNLDPDRFAAYGGSAGAGISMWLGFHDDLADPKSDDPVARQSTRLTCIGTFGGQTSYDPKVIREWIGGRAWEHPSIFLVYNVKTLDELGDPKLQSLFDECAAIKHLSQDDPPIIMFYSEADGPLPADARPGQGIHHPVFGRKLKEAMDPLGIECHNHYRDNVNPNVELVAFFKRHLLAEK